MRSVYRDRAFWLFLFLSGATLFFVLAITDQGDKTRVSVEWMREQIQAEQKRMEARTAENVKSMADREQINERLNRVEQALKRLDASP